MAEWLTHVLIAYGLFTVCGWYVDWLDERWVAVGVVGSILPDLNRLDLVISDDLVTALLGVPFSWDGLHTIGGVTLLSAIGALLFATARQRRRAFVVLFVGGLSHLVVDLPQAYADGAMLTNLYLFPLTTWRPPTPGWYVSADRWVALVALAFALAVFLADRYRTRANRVARPAS
ncbi:metal-dependent hydrolase [Natrarchaeobius oligotrophus]|uniref:Metal-dependent hydrolase n=1 Tax=Natrarchaeobius chitinivorans TaxID=1679083 RepID=A0A3N6MTY2_NATCH|nr:metal-dependent hydrolase [Natrarchaeobius chitinivorans]RQG99741.1 metal-dependent hydrolase [Natrarchaeobius chitinivorans]